MDLSVVILAAGQGKRMQSTQPKVLQTLGAKPMLQHVLEVALGLSPQAIYVITGYQAQQVKQTFIDWPVHWIEQPVPLGTGDAVRQALPYLNTEQLLILYGDVPLLSLSMLDNFLQQTPQQALGILTAKVDNPLGLGRIVRNQVDEIIAIVEEQDATLAQRQITEVNTGIYLAPTHYLKACLPLNKTLYFVVNAW
jgi:bifunctional UDP-N-acetylglucosamine pyrophosphorylase/glucosamine-1-phosphate N-acetyltransferase